MGAFCFSKNVKIVPILSQLGTAAGDDRTSEVIDTKGFAAFAVVVHTGEMAASADTTLSLLHSDAVTDENTLDTGVAVAGSSFGVISATDDGKVYGIDVIKPTKRYYQVDVNKDGTNVSDETAICYLYRSASSPTTQAAGTSTVGEGTFTSAMEMHVSPISGDI